MPALPLQLLLLRNPAWDGAPVAVVDVDKPQGHVVWANVHARRQQVRPGMRYAAALSLEPQLRAGVIEVAELGEAVDTIVARLRAFSPEIEPSEQQPGVFWLDASGFEGLYPSLEVWARRVVDNLRGAGFVSAVVVGFERFGSYALARQGRGAAVLDSPEEERARSDRVRLDLLEIEPKLRAALDRLGVNDVGKLRRLPDGGLLERFGEAGGRLQRFVNGQAVDSLAGVPVHETIEDRFEIDPDETPFDATGLLFAIKRHLGPLCAQLARRGEALASLWLRILLEDVEPIDDTLRPADPTLDEVQVLDLVRLRLERVDFAAAVIGFELRVEGARATREQLELFVERPRRDLAAANRALARVRAEFGDDRVLAAVLREGHLPEASFYWRPLGTLRAARPVPNARMRLVSRILARPQVLHRERGEPDGWCAAGLAGGPVQRTFGPYVVSGGWWRHEVHRAYHFVETERGDVLWVFYDRRRRKWCLHGVVE